MLQIDENAKIEQYINKISEGIYQEAKKFIQSGMSDQQIIDKVISIAVKKFTPESKMVMSSVYNMMMEHTLANPIFQNAQNKAVFYERDILKELNSKFLFDVPKYIDYEESKAEIKKWIAAGVIVIVGGIISIPTNNLIPIEIAIIVAGVMLFILNDLGKKTKHDISKLIKEYLHDVKKMMMEWLNTVQVYYDECVYELEKELTR
ncbi:hypothetical protein J4O15_02020 [Lachnoanaerobaculum sp. Marseille-Q4761]|uniref:hypothetical protein n=1 Tax=Lachnoanaerobaculum sp. Marseille-Q4761 TaxID=2819511 RepID=UPI001AA1A3B4|nr:hypothetical protein [Lachnoanaerobaculum sp. Marseille-Q4761]MBO1869755.1 hypothetical protein [Lachnoanaerobaculum sp. Marseille-Q4761]